TQLWIRVLSQVRDELVVLVEKGHATIEIGDHHVVALYIATTRALQHAAHHAQQLSLEIEDLESRVLAIGDHEDRRTLAGVEEDPVRGLKLAGRRARTSPRSDVVAGRRKLMTPPLAVAVGDVDIAIRRDHHAGRLVLVE